MEPTYAAQIEYYCSYWRRSVAEGSMNLADLKALATSLYTIEDTEVIITETGFQTGVITRGQVSIPKWVIGKALEDLIREMDPDAPAVPSDAQGTSRGYGMVLV